MEQNPINRENIAGHLLDYQLKLAGKSRVNLLDDYLWRFNWTITTVQQKQFHDYAIPLIKKIFKCNKSKAEETFNWFIQQFGLRIKN